MKPQAEEKPVIKAGVEEKDYSGAKYGMWFFLLTEILFFGGMFLLYSVYRYRFPGEFHAGASEENLVWGSINTVLLLTSSLFMAAAITAVKKGNNKLSVILQALTVVLGVVFLFIKGSEWGEKIVKGLYPSSPALLKLGKGEILYFGLYYVMTGLHGLHVFVGIVVILFMMYYTVTGKINKDYPVRLENTGLYWHFVDMVWIYLFPLFYLVT
ncbi:MAG: cytochrome c oxidase subunit 3 family protein [Candidatus Sulfobium sp.]|jgi:cytochrome c oxidase subunit 3